MKSSPASLRLSLIFLILALSILSGEKIESAIGQDTPTAEEQNPNKGEASPLYLTANDLSIATGKPSLVVMSKGSTHIPVWSLSGGTTGQSVSGVVGGLPENCVAVKVEIVVT